MEIFFFSPYPQIQLEFLGQVNQVWYEVNSYLSILSLLSHTSSRCRYSILTCAYGAKYVSAVMWSMNFPVFVNFPKHVPTVTNLSGGTLVDSSSIFSDT